jgi:hypothetical protein
MYAVLVKVSINESRDAAQQVADGMGANVPQGVTFESAEVREVIANA